MASSKGFCIPEEGHFVNLIVGAHDLNAAAHHFPVINMQYWHHVDIFMMLMTTPRVATVITIESCSNWVTLDGSPTTATKIAFEYRAMGTVAAPTSQITDGNDIMSAPTAVTVPATGFSPASAAVDDIVYVVSLESSQLAEDHIGFRLDIADPGAACTAVVFAICSGGRYQGEVQESVTKV